MADDIFSVILDPYLDRRNGYRFTVNPNGVRWEGLYQNITDIQGNWDGIWQADALVVDNGWYSDMRIPYASISFNPDSAAWGINFRREIRRNNEGIGWVSRNRQLNPSIAGTITGLAGLDQGLGLDVVPSMTVREERVYGPVAANERNFEPSLDVFYKLTPQLNASLTVNTDFSATSSPVRPTSSRLARSAAAKVKNPAAAILPYRVPTRRTGGRSFHGASASTAMALQWISITAANSPGALVTGTWARCW